MEYGKTIQNDIWNLKITVNEFNNLNIKYSFTKVLVIQLIHDTERI